MAVPLSILDLAPVIRGESHRDALLGSVRLAQRAEALGYRRIWYAEHHNMPRIASAATSVLIAHIAAHTEEIRLGSGGVMLPNHAPLTIAEQFGTLASLHPGRIDLGLGRAPGTDQNTLRALRRSPTSAERFPDDVLELQGYLAGESRIPGVRAIPGEGTNVPLYILGSSLFGAKLAAVLGLPYAFASHFAPAALTDAVSTYRAEFRASAQLVEPYVIAGVNVIAAPTSDEARTLFRSTARKRVRLLYSRAGHSLTSEEAEEILDSPAGAQAWEMLRCSAVGTPAEVSASLDDFAVEADADELIVASSAPERAAALRSIELLGEVRDPAGDRSVTASPTTGN